MVCDGYRRLTATTNGPHEKGLGFVEQNSLLSNTNNLTRFPSGLKQRRGYGQLGQDSKEMQTQRKSVAVINASWRIQAGRFAWATAKGQFKSFYPRKNTRYQEPAFEFQSCPLLFRSYSPGCDIITISGTVTCMIPAFDLNFELLWCFCWNLGGGVRASSAVVSSFLVYLSKIWVPIHTWLITCIRMGAKSRGMCNQGFGRLVWALSTVIYWLTALRITFSERMLKEESIMPQCVLLSKIDKHNRGLWTDRLCCRIAWRWRWVIACSVSKVGQGILTFRK